MLTTKGTQRPMPQDRICIVASKEFFLNTKTLVCFILAQKFDQKTNNYGHKNFGLPENVLVMRVRQYYV